MVGWISGGYFVGYVLVFVIGVGFDLFIGKMDNMEILKCIVKVGGYK